LPIPRKKINGREVGRPPQAVKGIMNVRDGKGILAGDGIDAPIVYAKAVGAIRLFGKANRGGPG